MLCLEKCQRFNSLMQEKGCITIKVNAKTRFSSEEVVMQNIDVGFTVQTFYSPFFFFFLLKETQVTF